MSPFKTNTKKDYYKPRKLEIKKKTIRRQNNQSNQIQYNQRY